LQGNLILFLKKMKKFLLTDKLLKTSIIAVFVFSLMYAITVFSVDGNFFQRDLQKKYGEVKGVKLSLLVAGDPDKPIVQATSGCDNYVAYVRLSWGANPLATSFEISRNGETLAVGITETEYMDESPGELANAYEVSALGANGSVISSDPVNITAETCAQPVPTAKEKAEKKEVDPTCKIKTIDAVSISQLVSPIITQNGQPIFTGRTNMDKAKIRIEIIGTTGVISRIRANKNGFWQWQVPIILADGTYEIRVKAISVNDSDRHKTASLIFKVKKKTPETILPSAKISPEEMPFDFEMQIQNPNKIVYSGENLSLQTSFWSLRYFIPVQENLIYRVFDPTGKQIVEITDKIILSGEQKIGKEIDLDKLLPNGEYKVSVETVYGNYIILAEDYFWLKEKPLFQLGTKEITLTEFLSGLGWIIVLLLILLLIFFLLLLLEKRLTRDGKIQITEQILRESGFLGKRKEANR
jgi:hypothetical protein